MSEYKHFSGGALKLKGDSPGKIKKKKRKSAKEKERLASMAKDYISSGGEESSKKSDTLVQVVTKTEAERKFEEIQRKRLEQKVQKAAEKSHKERVAELNRKLEEMTEHYDIPKVGPG